MKNIKIYYLLIAATAICSAGCTREEPAEFSGLPALYFFAGSEYRDGYTYTQDTVRSFTFIDYPDQTRQMELFIDVRTIGFPEEVARRVDFVQTNTGDQDDEDFIVAVPGVHYVPFDDPRVADRMNVAAGSTRGLIPLIILKHPDMEERSVVLNFRIVGNEYFSEGFGNKLNYYLTFSAKYEKPAVWNRLTSLFGEWGAVKMWFIVQKVGFNDWSGGSLNKTFGDALNARCRSLLKEYNENPDNENVPLKEKDGRLVTFPVI